MANFTYRVITKDGKEKKGSIEAENKEKALATLRGEGNTVLSVADGSVLNKEISIGGKKVKSRDFSIFCRQFNSLLTAGVGVVPALEMLADQTENKSLQAAVRNVHDSVQKGDTLAGSMKKEKVFPQLLVSMVEAGEASGNIEISLERMSEHFEKDTRVKGLLKKAMIYPIVILVVAVIVLVVMVVGVLPSFAEMFADMDAELPGLTKALLSLSDIIKGYWYIIIAVIAVIVVAIKLYGRTETGKRVFARLVLKLPVFGKLNVKTACARFARTFSTMLASGMPMLEAMEITSRTIGNILYQDALEETTSQIQRGVSLAQPLKKSGLFPPLVVHMVGIGEETGNLEGMLNNTAKYYDEEVELATQQVMALIEPMIIIVMAGIVILILGAIYGPIITMYNTLGNA
ncbi:MAG: type II secretion system F family protein [Butyrivibrio sp.]|nr:type II secretion system F family protein [Butyrivibrio sp.]